MDSKWQICRYPPTSRFTDERCYLIQWVQHAEHCRQRLSGKKQTNQKFKKQKLISRIALSCSWCICCEPKTAPQPLTNQSLKWQTSTPFTEVCLINGAEPDRLVHQMGWISLGLQLRALGNDPTWWPQDRLWPEWTEHEPSTFSEPLFIIPALLRITSAWNRHIKPKREWAAALKLLIGTTSSALLCSPAVCHRDLGSGILTKQVTGCSRHVQHPTAENLSLTTPRWSPSHPSQPGTNCPTNPHEVRQEHPYRASHTLFHHHLH